MADRWGSDLILRVQGQAGSSIHTTVAEALDLARHLRLMVVFDFNGVHMVAPAHGDADEIVAFYFAQLKRDAEREAASAS